MKLRTKAGEAVMLVIMGAMIVGGIVVWLSTGHFHMMPMHGDKHTVDKHVQEKSASSEPHDAQTGHAASRSEEPRETAGQQDTESK
ncbi:MAG: hypothetical protein HZB63_08605 [Deltaproteobacteria bacterium]|nr:hypothetical protein [Deltaproteobacteria bacterium]